MGKMTDLKAKKKKKSWGVHPSLWIMSFLFVVKLEIIQYIGQSSENCLKAGGRKCLEILWYLVGVQVPYASFSSTWRALWWDHIPLLHSGYGRGWAVGVSAQAHPGGRAWHKNNCYSPRSRQRFIILRLDHQAVCSLWGSISPFLQWWLW